MSSVKFLPNLPAILNPWQGGPPTIRSTSFGDMVITINVEIPKNLSDNQKRLLKEFNEELSQKNNPESTGFFTKVKDFWDGLT